MRILPNDLRLIPKGLKEIRSIRPNLLSLIFIKCIFSALFPFVNIYMSAFIINKIVEKSSFKKLVFYAFLTIVLDLVIAIIMSLLNRKISIVRSEFGNRYQMRLNEKIMSLDYAVIEKAETHHIYQKIKEYRNINGGGIWCLIDSFQVIIENLFTIGFSIALTFSLFFSTAVTGKGMISFLSSGWASLIVIICIFLNVFLCMWANAIMTKKMYSMIDDIIPFNRIFEYYLGSYISTYHAGKDIRIFNQKKLIRSEYMSVLDDALGVADNMSRNQVKYSILSTASTVILNTIVYGFVGLKALLGLFGVGSIAQYVGSINRFTSGLNGLVTQFVILRSNNEALKVYFDFMELPSDMDSGNLEIEKNNDIEYEIEFKNVSFKYPGADNYALRNLNIKFCIGKRLAVVGMNGSGKTTMVKLLCRLYDPTEGEITLNGIDIKKYRYNEYISLFSTVFQDFKLLSFSLGQNVTASSEINSQSVTECLQKAGFSDRVATMPNGIDTALYKDFDENGVEISGGEAQKIALARALYKDSPFIVLDEPTAALDPISEYEIYSKFSDIVGNNTVIYISHRLSSCRFCDEIAVFDNGKLVQQGNHDTLMADESGKYHELWHAQAQYYSD